MTVKRFELQLVFAVYFHFLVCSSDGGTQQMFILPAQLPLLQSKQGWYLRLIGAARPSAVSGREKCGNYSANVSPRRC